VSDEHPNCQAIDRFLTAIPYVNRPIVRTQNVDEKPVDNGFTASWHDQASNSGFTIIAMNDGDLLLMVEGRTEFSTTGKLEDAEAFAARVNQTIFAKP
jgi:hypothetical protein